MASREASTTRFQQERRRATLLIAGIGLVGGLPCVFLSLTVAGLMAAGYGAGGHADSGRVYAEVLTVLLTVGLLAFVLTSVLIWTSRMQRAREAAARSHAR